MEQAVPYLTTGVKSPLLPHLLSAIDRAESVDIAVAFTRVSGLALILPALEDAIERKVPIRFLTSDYLDVTEPNALRMLMLLKEQGLDIRLFSSLRGQSFHPKAYITLRESNSAGTSFIGSSNLSESALINGIEWNIRIEKAEAPATFGEIEAAFKALFTHPDTDTLGKNTTATAAGQGGASSWRSQNL